MLLLSSADFFKFNFSRNQSDVILFESRSGPALCHSGSGSKMFAKVINRRKKLSIARLGLECKSCHEQLEVPTRKLVLSDLYRGADECVK